MLKFAWTNVESFKDAEYVIFGVADEQGSHSYRKGSAHAPERIRKISVEREVFERKGKTLAQPMDKTLSKKIFDHGNVARAKIAQHVETTVLAGKIPITLGGDHSITAEVIRGISSAYKSKKGKNKKEKIALVYLDAHPDIICSSRHYYGSVVCDLHGLGIVDMKKSFIAGMREPEIEEFTNIRKNGINTITAMDFFGLGTKKTFEKIKKSVGKMPVYLSIDIDVVDPAFAPGASTPSPGGLSSMELICFAKKAAKELNLIGLDVMEVNPLYDVQDMTSHLAAKLIIETISSGK